MQKILNVVKMIIDSDFIEYKTTTQNSWKKIQ